MDLASITHTNNSRSGNYLDSCNCAVSMLYVLDGTNPDFCLIFEFPDGEMETEPHLHLRNFLDLCARMRAAFPVLNRISDHTLLIVLEEVSGGYCSDIGLVRLMLGHPDRGDGEP